MSTNPDNPDSAIEQSPATQDDGQALAEANQAEANQAEPNQAKTNEPQPVQTKQVTKSRPARKIQIGSQRDAVAVPSQPKAVQLARTEPVDIEATVPKPPEQPPAAVQSLEGLGEDLDAEIEAAIGGVSMDAVIGGMAEDEELPFNSRIKGTVTKIHGENVFVNLKGRFEGVVPLRQFKKQPAEGLMAEFVIKNRNEDDGLYEVAIPGSAVAVGDWEDLQEGEIVEARVSGSNTGGLEVMVNNIRGFIPASQIERFRVENFGEYVNQKLQCLVTEVNPKRRKLVLSRRAVLEKEHEEQRKELLASIEPGSQHDGTVTKLMDFGAFVDIGGVEGLVHVSKLSWDRVSHPKEAVSQGERVKVKVESVNRETGKISLSIRDMMTHPWDDIDRKYAVNDVVKGTVSKIADFGAFVKLEPGIEGLVHISEIAHHRVIKVGNHVKPGDQVDVKILSIDSDKQKLGLSIKATQAAPELVKGPAADQEVDEPVRELAVKKADDEPLKGGTDRKSGGESVGLNW